MGRNRRDEIQIQDPMLRKLIGNLCSNVKKKRQKLGLTQQELAINSKLATNTIAEIEQERIEDIRLSTITSLAKGFDLEPFALFKKTK